VKTVAAIALLCGMFYLVFLDFHIEYFPNGHPFAEDFAFCVELTQKYGRTLEPDEFDAFYTQTRDELIAEADGFIAHNTRLTGIGIYDYAGLLEAEEKYSQEDPRPGELLVIYEEFYYWSASKDVNGADINTAVQLNTLPVNYKIQALNSIARRYEIVLDPTGLLENGLRGLENMPGAKASQARYVEMASTEEIKGIIPDALIDNTVAYAGKLAILLVMATLVLLAPLITSDRIRKIHLLQYTAKTGRRIIRTQLAGILLSSLLLTTALTTVFGAIYATNGIHIFWNNYVSSFNSFCYLSVPLTFGQYVMVMTGMLYVLGLGFSAIAFILSRYSTNFIALVAGLIPVAVAGNILFFNVVFERPLNAFIVETGIALFEPLICAVFLALGIVAAVCVVRREKKIDII
jgi:hypothetical protein